MTQHDKDPLNGLLQQWASRHAADPAGVQRLRDGIVQRVEADRLGDLPPMVIHKDQA